MLTLSWLRTGFLRTTPDGTGKYPLASAYFSIKVAHRADSGTPGIIGAFKLHKRPFGRSGFLQVAVSEVPTTLSRSLRFATWALQTQPNDLRGVIRIGCVVRPAVIIAQHATDSLLNLWVDFNAVEVGVNRRVGASLRCAVRNDSRQVDRLIG